MSSMTDACCSVKGFNFACNTQLRYQVPSGHTEVGWTLPFENMDKSNSEECRMFNLQRDCPRHRLCPYRHIHGEKTTVCKHWLKGLCKKGDGCEWLHKYEMYRMMECQFFRDHGNCTNPDCDYLHIDPESKRKDCPWYGAPSRRRLPKTEDLMGVLHIWHGQTCKNRHRRKVVCVRYVSGFCPLGPDCELAHLPWEMTLLGKDEEGNEIAIKKLPTHD
eukprot:gene21762-35600_t